MKKCSKCKLFLQTTGFFKNRSRPDGLQKWCKECVKTRDAKRKRPYNPEKQKKHRKKRVIKPESYEKHLVTKRAANKRHYAKHKEAYFARAVARMSRLRTSVMLHDDPKNIAAIYAQAAKMRKEGHDVQVDHIIPLHGRLVSGLHVSWNLQIIPSIENRRKSNKFRDDI